MEPGPEARLSRKCAAAAGAPALISINRKPAPIESVFMAFLDALWHVMNFLLLPAMLGAIASAAVKLLWRQSLAKVAWHRLALWSSASALVAQVGGLVITGRDGRMMTYLAMVAACALTLWWQGFLRGHARKPAR